MSDPKILKTVKVGPYNINVVERELIDADGLYQASKSLISLTDKSTSKEYKDYLLMHECIHAFFDVYGLLHGITDLDPDDAEEFLAQQMAVAFLAFIKDNTALVEGLQI